MIARWVVLGTLAGCGRVDFDAMGDAPDAVIDDTTVVPSGTTLLDDPFDDTVPGPAFLAIANSLTIVEAAGHLEVQLGASVTGNFGFYRTAKTFPMAGACATAEVSEVPTGVASAYMKLRGAQREVELFTYSNRIQMRTYDNPTIVIRGDTPLDLVTSRFWRICQQADVTLWQTSPDGLAYATHASLAGFFTTPAFDLEIGGGSAPPATNAGVARFERAVIVGP